MKINLKESLNELDVLSNNRYDLYNIYLSKNPSLDTKKKLSEAIYNNKSPKEILMILKEDWDDAAWHDTADQEQLDQPDYFPDDEEEVEWEEMNSKSVRDSDGFLTDYTWYRNNETGQNVFVFGDKDLYRPEDGYFDWECDTDMEGFEWFKNYVGPGDDEDLEESLNEKMVKVEPSDKELNQVINVLNKYGFKVDDNYKPGRGLFGSYHIQVINPDLTYIDDDQFVKAIEPLEDDLDHLSTAINMPITYNFGANEEGVVTAGVDIHVGYKNDGMDESLKEDSNLDDFIEPVDQVGKAKIYYDSNKRTYFTPSLDLDFETLDQAKDFIGAPLYMGESLKEDFIISPEKEYTSEYLSEGLDPWYGKYVPMMIGGSKGEPRKVYFYFDSTDFEEAEEEFFDIIPEPYVKAKLYGRASESSLVKDGWKNINESLNEASNKSFSYIREKPQDYILDLVEEGSVDQYDVIFSLLRYIDKESCLKVINELNLPSKSSTVWAIINNNSGKFLKQSYIDNPGESYHDSDFSVLSNDTGVFNSIDKANDFIDKYLGRDYDTFGAKLLNSYQDGYREVRVESLSEASYGGAFDIEDDMYFTSEDIVEFGDTIAIDFSKEVGRQFDLSDAYMTTPTQLHLEFTDNDFDYVADIKIDMRKIRVPSDIYKYKNEVLKQLREQISNEDSY